MSLFCVSGDRRSVVPRADGGSSLGALVPVSADVHASAPASARAISRPRRARYRADGRTRGAPAPHATGRQRLGDLKSVCVRACVCARVFIFK